LIFTELPDFFSEYFLTGCLYGKFYFSKVNTAVPSLQYFCSVAQIPPRSLKRILDHSKVRFTANPKLALWAQTIGFAAVSLP
jgi:hypothetical protein